MWYEHTVCVVLPAYNEADGITDAVKGFLAVSHYDGTPIVDQVLVVNNNSSDRTSELARAAGAVVVDETRQGYGNAIMCGLGEAKQDIVVICEPDGTFIPGDIFKLLSYIGDFDLVCGTRTTRELFWEEANMGIFLRWGNFAVAKLLELLYGTCSLSDCGCTFRLIRQPALRRILGDLFVGGSHFLPNMIISARLNGLSFIEIPVTYKGRVGVSKITGTFYGTWKTGIAMILFILSQWPKFLLRRQRH